MCSIVSLQERIGTTFKPVLPSPYLNGGARDFLPWVIQCPEDRLAPDKVAELLEGHLPRPVEGEAAWAEPE